MTALMALRFHPDCHCGASGLAAGGAAIGGPISPRLSHGRRIYGRWLRAEILGPTSFPNQNGNAAEGGVFLLGLMTRLVLLKSNNPVHLMGLNRVE